MIRLLLLLLLLLLGLSLGPVLLNERGYVLIASSSWSMEMNFISLALVVVGAVAAFLILEWTIKWLVNLVKGTLNWLRGRKARKNKRAFAEGMAALDSADYARAAEQLDALDSSQFSGVDLLGAAQAAVKLGQWDKARDYWQKASEFDDTALPARMHLIEYELQQGNSKAALERIQQLPDKQARHPRVLNLWAQSLAQAGQWQQLQSQLKRWKKLLSDEDLQHWRKQCAEHIYAELASKEGAHPLKDYWQQLPRATRKDPAQQAAFISQLLAHGLHEDAQQALLEHQKKGPQPLLLPLFRELRLPNPAGAIKRLESWIKADNDDPELLSVLGQLAINAGDLILAEKALTRAIKLNPNQRDILLLARIKEDHQQTQDALELYKKSLHSAS